MRAPALLLLLSIISIHPGCVDERKGDFGDPCLTGDDCQSHMACLGGICDLALECSDERPACGDDCCLSTEDCVNGSCLPHCASGVWCGTFDPRCCAYNEVCASSQCCTALCSGECCDCPDCICRDGQCRSTMEFFPCYHCTTDEVCLGDMCCRSDRVCGRSCCAEGEVCEAGSCRLDCGGLARCGDPEACCEEGRFCDTDLESCWPLGETGACGSDEPDLVPLDFRVSTTPCPTHLTVAARVLNRGDAEAAPPIPCAFFLEDPASGPAAVVFTTRTLLPGQSQEIYAYVPLDEGTESVLRTFSLAVDDDGTGSGVVAECLEDNNRSNPTTVSCSGF